MFSILGRCSNLIDSTSRFVGRASGRAGNISYHKNISYFSNLGNLITYVSICVSGGVCARIAGNRTSRNSSDPFYSLFIGISSRKENCERNHQDRARICHHISQFIFSKYHFNSSFSKETYQKHHEIGLLSKVFKGTMQKARINYRGFYRYSSHTRLTQYRTLLN